MNGGTSYTRSAVTGRVALQAPPDVDAVEALRSFAPQARPVICETPEEFFHILETGSVEYGFMAAGNYRRDPVIDVYQALANRNVAIVGDYVHEPSQTRFLLIASGQWEHDASTFSPDRRSGSIWLEMPVLAEGRTSVMFVLPDDPGALVRALGPMSRRRLNVRKLEMRPPGDDEAVCTIAADIEGYADASPLREALGELRRLAQDMRVLGAYPVSR